MEAFTAVTKLVEATHFLFYRISYVGESLSKSCITFKPHSGSSWVEAMEEFTDVTKLDE